MKSVGRTKGHAVTAGTVPRATRSYKCLILLIPLVQAVGVGAFEPKQHDTATRGNKNRKENSLDCLLRNHYVNGPFYQMSHNNFAKLAVPVSEKKQTQEDVVTALQSTKLGLGLQLPYLATRP